MLIIVECNKGFDTYRGHVEFDQLEEGLFVRMLERKDMSDT